MSNPNSNDLPALDRSTISAMRRSYGEVGLSDDATEADPFVLFATWLNEAVHNPVIVEANAMVLSTVALGEGRPEISSRTVLLKDISHGGFTFFTNYQSRKAEQISSTQRVSLLFPWYAMERQVIVIGDAERIDPSESDAYFATRPWSSQIGAWASSQSAHLESREILEERWSETAEKWPEGAAVPRPPHWGGFRVAPESIEFWQGRHSRLHDRIRFIHDPSNNRWNASRYYP